MSNDEQCRHSIEDFIRKTPVRTSSSFVDFLRCLPKSICTSKRYLNICISELREKYQFNSILCSRLNQLKQQLEINFPDESSSTTVKFNKSETYSLTQQRSQLKESIDINNYTQLITKVKKVGRLLTEKCSKDHIAHEMDRLLNDMRKINYSNPIEFKLACHIEHSLRRKVEKATRSIIPNNIYFAIRMLVYEHSLTINHNSSISLNNLNRVLKRIIEETTLYDY